MSECKGITKGYPQIQKRFGKIASYLQLIRPFTLLAPFLAGLLGVLSSTSISFDVITNATFVGVTLALAQATGQILNQYADVDLDKTIKPYRPIPSGALTREEALGLSWLFAIISVARAFTINESFGLGTISLLFFAVFYSLSPFSPRRIHPIFNILWMAVSRGFTPLLLVWSVYGTFNQAVPYACLGFLWVLGFQSTKDIPDIAGDKQHGIKTIPSCYGTRGIVLLMTLCTGCYIIVALLFELYLLLILVPVAIGSCFGLQRKSKLTENTYGWMGFYLGLALLFVLMFLTERLAL